jgi:hypothetical protein
MNASIVAESVPSSRGKKLELLPPPEKSVGGGVREVVLETPKIADDHINSVRSFAVSCKRSSPLAKESVVKSASTDRWEKKILYGLGVSPNRTEFGAFEPGQSPKLLGKANFGIP